MTERAWAPAAEHTITVAPLDPATLRPAVQAAGNSLTRIGWMLADLHAAPGTDEDQIMTTLYCRPTTHRVTLRAEPQLACWDITGSPGQVRLGEFLDHAQAVAAPILAAVDGLVAVELTVGLRDELPLTSGGRDLDNYLFPLAQRLGPARIAAMFGRKVHGPSFLAVGRAQPDHSVSSPSFPLRSPVPISARNGKRRSASGSCKSSAQPWK